MKGLSEVSRTREERHCGIGSHALRPPLRNMRWCPRPMSEVEIIGRSWQSDRSHMCTGRPAPWTCGERLAE